MDEHMIDPPPLRSAERRRSSMIQVPSSSRSNSLEISVRNTPPISSSISMPAQQSARGTPKEDLEDTGPYPTPSRRPGLRIKNTPAKCVMDPMDGAMKPLTDDERRDWKGWVELESDPALFNFILRQYGVKDVKVQECLGLEDISFSWLPKPVYGLIFLFKYREDEEVESDDVPKCPKHVWFANQTITNACATIALLNIVMNVKEIELGTALATFKIETEKLKPAYRGQRLGQDDFIRSIHNSFARRIDMLNADLALLNEMEKWERTKKNPKRKGTTNRKSKKKAEDDDEAGFHFIAYVPIKGDVWRLDGLQRQPINLGRYEQDWMTVARANMLQKIAEHGEEDQYSLLSLCKSPLLTVIHNLAENIRSIVDVESALNTTSPEWRNFSEIDDSDLETGPTESFGISNEIFSTSHPPESAKQSIENAKSDPDALIKIRGGLIEAQMKLKVAFMEEASLIGQEDEQAARRKHDYTPIIYHSIKSLAEEGVLKEIIEDIQAG